MQLAGAHGTFEDLGIAVAVMSYDRPATNNRFVQRRELPFPLLSDKRGRHAIAFGIPNEQNGKRHRAYGIPHPGIFLVDSDGVIRGKFAERDYAKRPEVGLLIEAAKQLAASSSQ